MVQTIGNTSYSYKDDPAVPDFPHDGPVVFMDGACVLCSHMARLICKLDKQDEFRICPVQSDTGQAVLRHYGIDANDPDSWMYLEDGEAYSSMDAVIQAGRRLGGIGYLVMVLSLFPRFFRDWLYGFVARNRYRIWGKTDMCGMPDERLRQKIMN